ncbi:hypothetical protein P692DRAFT_20713286 [Suillus brevipes Sb2]|nr:hypothetical protein P692DRAFT_20713286 [Suillus brevipes Sb2]
MSCSTRSPRMLTSKCASTRSRIRLRSGDDRVSAVSTQQRVWCLTRCYIVTHTATFDFWPQIRHALRATPHGEKPESVEDYERRTGKVAKDRQIEIWKEQGIEILQSRKGLSRARRGYDD